MSVVLQRDAGPIKKKKKVKKVVVEKEEDDEQLQPQEQLQEQEPVLATTAESIESASVTSSSTITHQQGLESKSVDEIVVAPVVDKFVDLEERKEEEHQQVHEPLPISAPLDNLQTQVPPPLLVTTPLSTDLISPPVVVAPVSIPSSPLAPGEMPAESVITHSPAYPSLLLNERQVSEDPGQIAQYSPVYPNQLEPGEEEEVQAGMMENAQENAMLPVGAAPPMEEEEHKQEIFVNLQSPSVHIPPTEQLLQITSPIPVLSTPNPMLQQQQQSATVVQPLPVHQYPSQLMPQINQIIQQQAQTQSIATSTVLPPQLSVPSMLQEQMQARALQHQKVTIASTLGPLESDALTAALVQSKTSDMHAFGTWFERKAGALRGRFYDLVEQFRLAQFNVSNIQNKSLDIAISTQIQLQNVWRLRGIKLDQKQVCADGATLEHSITHAIADFDNAGAEAAYERLVELQRQGIQELTSHRFLAQSNLLQVELFLSELLNSKGLFSNYNLGNASGEGVIAPGGATIVSDDSGPGSFSSSVNSSSSSSSSLTHLDFIHQLRYCIDVLFYFEKYRDPEHEKAKAVWRIRARERRDQQAALDHQAAMTAAILTAQPNQVGPPEHVKPVPPLSVPMDFIDELDDFDSTPAPASSSSSSSVSSPLSSPQPHDGEDFRFRASIRRWLKLLVDALYTVGGYTDHLYVLSQVLRCRGITRWASFVQVQRANAKDLQQAKESNLAKMNMSSVPGGMLMMEGGEMDKEAIDESWEWTPDFIQFLLSSFTLILSPLDGKQLKFQLQSPNASSSSSSQSEQIVGGGGVSHLGEWSKESKAEDGESVRISANYEDDAPPVLMDKPLHSLDKSLTLPHVEDSGAEWTLLDETKIKNAFNADVSYRVSLNESDYSDILSHLPILPFVRSRVYPLFLAFAKRHVENHGNEAGGGGLEYDNAYEAFDRHTLTEAFTHVKCILQLLSSALSRFPEYPQLSKFIAKQMCQIVGFVGEAWDRAWKVAHRSQSQREDNPGARSSNIVEGQPDVDPNADITPTHASTSGLFPYPCCHAAHGFYGLLQKELDFCLLRLICTIQHCQSSGIKFFLSDLPFHILSTEAAGQAFLILMNQSHISDYQDSSLSFTPLLLSSWFQYLATPPGVTARTNFTSLLLHPDGGYIHILMALTKLCTKQTYEISPFVIPPVGSQPKSQPHFNTTSSETHDDDDDEKMDSNPHEQNGYRFRSAATDLPLIYLNELFQISYLNLQTREELFRPCQGFITSLCATHPLSISFLLFLCHTYFRYIGTGAVALFQHMDLNPWRPTASDMYIIQSLLLTPSHSPANELGRCILVNLNYNFIITPDKELSSGISRRGSLDEVEGGGGGSAASSSSISRIPGGRARFASGSYADPSHLFFPPRSRTPVLGWQFHRSLLLMLSDVRLATLRSSITPSAASSSLPAVPFTSFVQFPTCAFQHMLTTSSRRNSHTQLATSASTNSLPKPPPVEQHLQQQYERSIKQQSGGVLSPSGSISPHSAPAFSSAAPPLSNITGLPFSLSTPTGLSALLAPASAALADVFSSKSKPIDPAWWIRVLSLLTTRDTDGSVPIPVANSWLSHRYAVQGLELEDYTNLIRRDPVLAYIQLQVSSYGTDSIRFVKEGWNLMRCLLSDSTFQPLGYRALHDCIPPLIRGISDPASESVGRGLIPSSSWDILPVDRSIGSSTPPRVPSRRPSIGGNSFGVSSSTPPMGSNPFLNHGPILSASASVVSPSSARNALAQISTLGIVKTLFEQSKPKSVFSVFQSKSITYEGIQLLSQSLVAHLLAVMRIEPPSPANESSMSNICNFWLTELTIAPIKSHHRWTHDHNLRYLFDVACRTLFIWNDWISGNRANAIVAPALLILYKFIGAQAVACAIAQQPNHSSTSPPIGAERKNGSYLEVNASPALNPGAAAKPNEPAPEVELQFDFPPNVNPPKHIVDSLLPPESLLTAFALNPKDALARHPWATFLSLMEDTLADRAAWLKLGHLICRWDAKSVLKVHLKHMGITDERIRRNAMVRRWFVHALACPVDCPLLPLFWQQAFRLMFARMHLSQPFPPNMGGFFGYRFMTGTSGRQLVQQCREHLSMLSDLFSKRRVDAINQTPVGHTLHPAIHELPMVFSAMNSWLTADVGQDPSEYANSLRERLTGFGVTLQDRFLPTRLASILLPTAEKNVPLWFDLIDLGALRWEQLTELSSSSRSAEFLPTPQLYSMLAPNSVDAQNHAFFHKYYGVQNYDLSKYAPKPSQLVAFMKRKPPTAASSSSNGSITLSAADMPFVFTAAEFSSPDVAKFGGPQSDLERALALSLVSSRGPVGHKKSNAAGSVGYWSATISPIPPIPVLGAPTGHQDPHSSAGLHIPSVLLSSVWNLLGHEIDALLPLKESIVLFTDRYSRAMALDRQFIDFYPLLYRNEKSDYTHLQPCRVGWGGQSKCRGPVRFYFIFTRALKIRSVEDNIEANRAQALACIDPKRSPTILQEIGLSFCASLIAIQRFIRQILEVAAQPINRPRPSVATAAIMEVEGGGSRKVMDMSPDSVEWQEHVIQEGLKWFFSLAELDSALAKLFPPAHFFLQSSIRALTPLITHPSVHSINQQERLLELLTRHTGLIAALSSSIRPDVAVDPNAYVQLFRLAIGVKDEQGITSAIVMSRFDIKRWLNQQPPPSIPIRQQLFTLCSTQLREEEKHPRRRAVGTPASASSEVICNYYAGIMIDLVGCEFPDLFMPYLKTILDDAKTFGMGGAPILPPRIGHVPAAPHWLKLLWQAAAILPLHMLPWQNLTKSCEWTEASLWEIRRAHQQHIQQQLAQKQPNMPPYITQSNVRLHALLGDLLTNITAFYVALFSSTHPSHYPSAMLDSVSSSVVCYASPRVKKNAAWQSVWQTFSAFMAPDPPPAPGSVVTAPPQHPYLDAQHQCVLDGFVMIMSILKSSDRLEAGWVFQRFWHCYTDQITVNAEATFLQLLHQTIIRATKLTQSQDSYDQPSPASPPFSPIPTQPLLDFRTCWVLSPVHLTSFQNTLKQVIELHEREIKMLIQAEKQHREAEHAKQIQLAKGTKRESKVAPVVDVRRSDVKMMSQVAVKVELIATFISHLMAACDWSYQLQQKPRFVSPAAKSEDAIDGQEMKANSPIHSPSPQSPPLASVGLFEPAVITNPYELYDTSPSQSYATSLLVTAIHVLTELPCAPFQLSSSSSNSSSPPSTIILPHFQRMLSTLLHIDWISVFLVRLPFEAFQMRYPRSIDDAPNQFRNPNVTPADEQDDGFPKSQLPSPDEMNSMGLGALEREINLSQGLLEQVSAILYSDRVVAKVVEEISHMTSLNASSSVTAPTPMKPSTFASLLSNPLATLVSVSSPTSASSSSLSILIERKEDGMALPRSPMPNSHVGPISDVDTYGLIRPHYNVRNGQLLVRYASDFNADECTILTPISRTAYTFHLMYRLCAPIPPIAYLQHPQSTTNKYFFVPLVLLLRKSRLFAEWLLSVFHGEDAPRPLMLESSYLELAGALLSHLNEYHDLIQTLIGDEEFIPVLQEFLFVANLEARGVGVSKDVKALTERIFSTQHEKLTLLAVTASCRSIIQLDKLAQFLEQVLQVWKNSHAISSLNSTSSAPNHWQTVSATLQVPEISFDDFILSCLNHGSILTLHVVSVQQLMMTAKMLSNPYSTVVSGGSSGVDSRPPQQPHSIQASASNFMDLVPATPVTPTLLNPLTKHTMAKPRSTNPNASSSVASSSLSTQPLDPKPIQLRVDQLFQWLSKTQVKLSPGEGKKDKKAPTTPTTAPSGLDEEDVEPVKLLVIIRTLFEWQGSLARGYLVARSMPTYSPVQPIRWSNPLLGQLTLFPDPYPLLTSADKLFDQLQLLLMRWLNEVKNSGSMLSMIGLSNTPRYSPKFRLLLKAIQTYLFLHVQSASVQTAIGLSSGQLKVSKAPPIHFNWDSNPANIAPALARTTLIQQFSQLATTKPFVPFANQIRILAAILTQSSEPERYRPENPPASTFIPLIYAQTVLDQLIGTVYPELGI